MKKIFAFLILSTFLLIPSVSALGWTPDWDSIFPNFDAFPDCSAINCANYISGPCQEYVTASYPICCQISNKPYGTSCGTLQICNSNGECVFDVSNIPTPTPCDDGNACTTGDMNLIGTCMGSPVVTGTSCPGGTCNANGQCIPLPIGPICGNQVCEIGENTANCFSDCYVPITEFCGDQQCNNGETCESCSQDCGDCCGNGIVLGVEECDDNGYNGRVCIPEEGESCTYCSLQCTLVTVQSEEPECTNESTIVSGTIFQETISNGIEGAIVEVVCHHGLLDNTLYAISESNGGYSVAFTCNQCDYNDLVTVNAEKEDLTGTEDGKVTMSYTLPCDVTINVGVVNVPLVPEFGTVIAMLTALSALGVFFIVRRSK